MRKDIAISSFLIKILHVNLNIKSSIRKLHNRKKKLAELFIIR